MKYILILVTFGVLPSLAMAEIVCLGKTRLSGTEVRVALDRVNRTATVQAKHQTRPTVYTNLSLHWDGFMTGLVTAKEFSMVYQDQFGCIRNASVTTVVQSNGVIDSVDFPVCVGESSHDSLCTH